MGPLSIKFLVKDIEYNLNKQQDITCSWADIIL